MLIALGVAYVIPFELLLFSYAFLGPAHYLTEISWLHDRSYFAARKWVWAPLAIFGVLVTALGYLGAASPPTVFLLLTACAAISAGFALSKTWHAQFGVMAAIGFALYLCRFFFPAFELSWAMLLPTVIHIYLFTGLFMLAGALKTNSLWGYVSVAVLSACSTFFIYFEPMNQMLFPSFVDRNLGVFDDLTDFIVAKTSMEGRVNSINVLAFLSFAYTYHYLNWFSKTEVIKWHKIPKRRFAVIAVLYMASISLYLIDFRSGFFVLTFLSLTHVLLELPLNVLSIKMIGGSMKERLGLGEALKS